MNAQDATLWALHIPGPDDVIPMPSHRFARAKAAELNAVFDLLYMMGGGRGSPYAPALRADVIVWDGSAADHQAAMAECAADAEADWYSPPAGYTEGPGRAEAAGP